MGGERGKSGLGEKPFGIVQNPATFKKESIFSKAFHLIFGGRKTPPYMALQGDFQEERRTLSGRDGKGVDYVTPTLRVGGFDVTGIVENTREGDKKIASEPKSGVVRPDPKTGKTGDVYRSDS